MKAQLGLSLCLALIGSGMAQTPQDQPPAPQAEQNKEPERWNLFYQATAIGQRHGTFRSPYEGDFSLGNYTERDVSLTTTLFLGLRLFKNTRAYINPEIAGGKGFSGVAGIANFPNGEIPRVASATPKPYLARAYLQQDFGFGSRTESFSSEENQLAGARPLNRYTITAGRFTVTDFFDNNRYSHDPRTQFMAWGIMYNAAWDYPADTRGYTWGWMHELHTENWSWRYASAAEPTVANGGRFDRRLLRDRGDIFEVERRYKIGAHSGAVRALGFVLHSRSGTYADALHRSEQTGERPDVIATRRAGTLKYGGGLNLEQEITSGIGLFGRLGWNDGKTETFAFTAIDRLANAGISVNGTRWKRREDTVGTTLAVSGIAGVHAVYLSRGGFDYIIGDGKLRYGPEYVWESYYSARVLPGLFASFDLQRVVNPAYNQDRGPVWVESVRLHLELHNPKR